ncbi:SUEL-type lectin domain-containing protein [Trichonephila clavata]|uniref:SUEL-type lectin domain-containing protein n=1 Tax=Trichonephila clavata TaxID=2740835 RepID=A0A8X6H2Q1_TRICU|nr:SUEL-type lectin domain-containing protein [Trichonephila clavata]
MFITQVHKLVITLNAFDTVLLFPCGKGETLSLAAERTCSSSHIHITTAVADTVKKCSLSALLTGTLRTFQVHACDGNELQIECWPNTVINIYLAQYGRQVPSHQLCPPEGVTDGDLSMLNDTTNCLSTHALRVSMVTQRHFNSFRVHKLRVGIPTLNCFLNA